MNTTPGDDRARVGQTTQGPVIAITVDVRPPDFPYRVPQPPASLNGRSRREIP